MKLLILLTLLFPTACMAQSLEISIEAGAALPVGAFGSSDAVDARIYSEELRVDGRPYIKYYSFEENGFASTGWFAGIRATWFWNKSWNVLLQYRFSEFPVEENPIARDFTTYYQRDHSYYQTDYQIQHLMTGLGKKVSLGAMDLNIQAMGGVARAGFPFYRIIDNYLSDPDRAKYPRTYYGHEGEREADFSFIWGVSADLTYPLSPVLSLGFQISYLASGFDYHIDPRWIPAGSGNFEYDEHVTFRALNIGLDLSYSF